MTKKEYTLIAQALHEVRPKNDKDYPDYSEGAIDTWTACIGSLITYFKANDTAFNSTDFLLACECGRYKRS